MHLDQMYTSTVNALKISITFRHQCVMVAGQALIDSGAMENFIDYQMAVRWRLNTKELWHPWKVYNMDGTENQGGIISKSCVLCIQQGEQQIAQRFYVTNLGQDCVILGYPWLREFNPNIDWEEG
jgi:Retroviral aspartyl protease